MLRKLQRKTLIPAQIAGYALTLLVGVAIVLLAVQVYCDLKPLLDSKTDVFSAHTVTVSKNVTVFKTANKEGLYFSEKELKRLKEQEFVKEVAQFNSATFNTSAAISFDGQRMSTDLFFESVPDSYLDIESDEWQWDSTSDFLPIIIPEDYLNLYNFGFAESQSLPVVSPAVLSQVTFSIFVEGNGKSKVYNSRIVGLTGKINSILVPEEFLRWANSEFGSAEEKGSSRLLGLLLIALGVFMWVHANFISRIDDGINSCRLVTTGIYAWVRNPIYSAIMSACTGVILLLGNLCFLILPFFFWLLMTVLLRST